MIISKLPITLIICLLLGGFVFIGDANAGNSPIKVACVGDSITAGAGAPKDRSYPQQLQEILGSGWDVKNFGRSGCTLLRNGDKPYWKDGKFQKAQDFKPDDVVIMLGTNDSKPQNWVYEGDFISDYRDMVKIFQALVPKPHIYLCRIPTVVEPNKYKISETVSVVIRQRIDDLAREMDLDVIPMDQAYGGDIGVLGQDKVHPNEQGALELAQTVARALKAAASGSSPAAK